MKKIIFSRTSTLFFISLFFLLFYGCIQSYRPQSPWEENEYLQSRFDIYPEDIRENPEKYQKVQFCWTGIIKESEFYEESTHYEVVLLMEHHYYDWKVDVMSSPDMYYLSRYGEGLFQTSWSLTKNADLNYFMDRFGPGNLAIVYARPDTVIDDIVLVKSDYIRMIDNEKVQADQLEYIPENIRYRSVPNTSYSN